MYTLRTRIASWATTKGSALDDLEFDDNFIGLKAEIDALVSTLAAISSHTQNEDQYLDFGGSDQVSASDLKNLVDEYPNISGSDDDKIQVNAAGTAFEVRSNAYYFGYVVGNSNKTTISSANTLTDINLMLTEDVSNDINGAGGSAISNNTGRDIKAKVTIVATVTPDTHAGDHDWRIGVAINGTDKTSIVQAYDDGSGDGFTITWCSIVEIPDGNTLQPRISNETDTDDVTVEHMQVTVEALN